MPTPRRDGAPPPTPFALVHPARQQDAGALQRALLQGCAPDLEDFEARTALSWAAAHGHDDMVEQLLAQGASPDRPNRFGRTPLMFAAEQNRHDVVRRLLAAGADVNRRDGRGLTPLVLALAVWRSGSCFMPPGTPPRPRLPPWRRVNASARWLWQAGARPPAPPPWWAPTRQWLNDALRADEFDEFGGRLRAKALLMPLLVALALAFVLTASEAGPPSPASVTTLLSTGVGLAVAVAASLHALGLFPAAVQWLARHGAPGLRQAVRRASAPTAAAPVTRLDAMALGQLLARRSVALRRELGAEADDAGALPLRLGRHADALIRWALVAGLYLLVLLWPAWANGTLQVAAAVAVALVLVVRRERQARRLRLQRAQARADQKAAALVKPPVVTATPATSSTTLAALPDARPSAQGFALYLRPFYTTAQVPVGGVDFESLLAYALSSTLPLVALGRPGEHIGAGRIQTQDAHWQQQVGVLLADARSIICIPSARPGTLWELQQLRARALLDKTVFIMPRDFIVRGLPGMPAHRFSDDWAETVAAAAGAGLELPDFQQRGLLFELDAGGRLLRHLPFRADPNLKLIAGLDKLNHDGHLRNDDPDQKADAGGDPGDATPYDLDGLPGDAAGDASADFGGFDVGGAEAGASADGASIDGFDAGDSRDGPGVDAGGGDRGG